MAVREGSLALHELKEQASLTDTLPPRRKAGSGFIPVAHPASEGEAPARETALGIRQIDKRQVLVVAQHRRDRPHKPRLLMARMNQHAHIHLLLENVLRILRHHAYANGTRAGVNDG